jgi:hypothetical protein
MTNVRKLRYALVVLFIVAAVQGCKGPVDQGGEGPSDVDTPQPTAPEVSDFPDQPLTVGEVGGAALMVDAGALSEIADVAVEDIGEGIPFGGGSPFSVASAEYYVDLGEARQVGSILMTVPLDEAANAAAAEPSSVYVAWTEPEGGFPSVVGVHVEAGKATFPVVGTGKYQLFKLIPHEVLVGLVSIFDPLAVPTYPQMTPAWCSPTALTNLVNYHQGVWPVGGFGAVWGESSNWYLAGKAGQPFNKGYFFHWLLGAGGYTVPSNVKQSFSDGNVEVIIWNWNAAITQGFDIQTWTFWEYTDYNFANNLFDAYQAYIEYFVWGVGGARRPVAWGSSLAGHSRTITGSNGTDYYFNNPSSGSLNSSLSWADYRQAVLDSLTAEKIEVIDTVVFHAEPRPSNARRGVLWLVPRRDDGFPGSVAMVDGSTGQPATEWNWDGDLGHANGYYFDDLRGGLPTDSVFDVQFKALHILDVVEYGFAVFNISPVSHDFHVDVILQNENLSVLKNVGMFDMQVAGETRNNFYPSGDFRLYDLPSGLYTLKFVLLQGGVYQDVKYVQFRVEESDLVFIIPHIVLEKNAFCRMGPATAFEDVTAFEVGKELELIGVNAEGTWGKIQDTLNDITFQCWVALNVGEVTGIELVPVLPSEPLPTEEPARLLCFGSLDRATCAEVGGIYVLGAEPPCQCPEGE